MMLLVSFKRDLKGPQGAYVFYYTYVLPNMCENQHLICELIKMQKWKKPKK